MARGANRQPAFVSAQPMPELQNGAGVSAAGEPPLISLQPSSAPREQEGVRVPGLHPLISPRGVPLGGSFSTKSRGAGGVHPTARTRRN